MDDMTVESDGTFLCEHEGGHVTRLNENDKRPEPPYYIICPDCGTHWIIWQYRRRKLAKPVIVPVYN